MHPKVVYKLTCPGDSDVRGCFSGAVFWPLLLWQPDAGKMEDFTITLALPRLWFEVLISWLMTKLALSKLAFFSLLNLPPIGSNECDTIGLLSSLWIKFAYKLYLAVVPLFVRFGLVVRVYCELKWLSMESIVDREGGFIDIVSVSTRWPDLSCEASRLDWLRPVPWGKGREKNFDLVYFDIFRCFEEERFGVAQLFDLRIWGPRSDPCEFAVPP